MQGYTQQSRMHPGATQAMNAGTGGLHQPRPKQAPMLHPMQPMQHPTTLSPLAQQLLRMKPIPHQAQHVQQAVPHPQGAQIMQLIAALRGGVR